MIIPAGAQPGIGLEVMVGGVVRPYLAYPPVHPQLLTATGQPGAPAPVLAAPAPNFELVTTLPRPTAEPIAAVTAPKAALLTLAAPIPGRRSAAGAAGAAAVSPAAAVGSTGQSGVSALMAHR